MRSQGKSMLMYFHLMMRCTFERKKQNFGLLSGSLQSLISSYATKRPFPMSAPNNVNSWDNFMEWAFFFQAGCIRLSVWNMYLWIPVG